MRFSLNAPRLALSLDESILILSPFSTDLPSNDSILSGTVTLHLKRSLLVNELTVVLLGQIKSLEKIKTILEKAVKIQVCEILTPGTHQWRFSFIIPASTAPSFSELCRVKTKLCYNVSAMCDELQSGAIPVEFTSLPTQEIDRLLWPSTNISRELLSQIGPIELAIFSPLLAISSLSRISVNFAALPQGVTITMISSTLVETTHWLESEETTTVKSLLFSINSETSSISNNILDLSNLKSIIGSTTNSNLRNKLLNLENGNQLRVEKLCRMPTHAIIHPSTNNDVMRTSHEIITIVSYTTIDSKSVKTLKMTAKVSIASCFAYLALAIPPPFAEKPKLEPKLETQCQCKLSAVVMLAPFREEKESESEYSKY